MANNTDFIPQKDIDSIIATDKAVTKLDDSTLEFIKTQDKLIENLRKEGTTLAELNKLQKEVDESLKTAIRLEKEQQEAVKALDKQRKAAITEIKKQEAAVISLDKQRQKSLTTIEKSGKATLKNAGREGIYFKELKKSEAQLKKQKIAEERKAAATKKAGLATIKAIGRESQYFKQLRQTAAQTKRNATSTNNYANALKRAGSQLFGALGITAGVFGLFRAFGNLIKRIREFDKEMQNMAGIVGTNRKGLKEVELAIREVASTSVRTSNEVAKLATTLFTLGKTREEVIQMLKPVNDLSIALVATSEETADFLGQTLNAFGKGAESSQEFADIIANIRQSTALDFERIKDALGFIAPTAKALGLTLGETGAIIGVLQDNGVKAARAGRLMNTSFARLIDRGLTLDDALARINTSTDKVATASDLFGARSFSLGLILADNVEKTARLGTEFDNLSEGSLKKLTDEQLKSLDAQFKILDSTWENFVLGIDSGAGIISRSLRGVISLSIDLINILNLADKTIGDIVVEVSDAALAENIRQDRQEIELMAKALEEGGVDAAEANKRAINSLIIPYVRLKETAAEPVSIQAQIDALREMHQVILDEEEELAKGKEAITVKLTDKEIKAAEKAAQKKLKARVKGIIAEKKEEESLAEFEEKIHEELLDFADKTLEAETESIKKEFDKRAELRKQDAQKQIELIEDIQAAKEELLFAATDALFEINGNFIEKNRQANQTEREEELLALEESLQNRLSLAEGNAEFERQINEDGKNQKAKINAKFDKEEKELARKKAVNDKIAALFQIALATAVAAIKQVAAVPLPLGAPLLAAVIAMGVIQAAIVATKPIPEFFKGTDNAPFGNLIAGDKGRELIDKDGKLMLVNEPTILSGLQGAKIYTNKETEKIISSSKTGYDSPDLRGVIESNNRIEKAIKNIPIVTHYPDHRKIIERTGRNSKTYLNKKLGIG